MASSHSPGARGHKPGRPSLVPKVWLTEAFRGQTATLERLRLHRQLDTALTQGPDPLHLASVPGLDPKTAIRYAQNARMLLVTAAEQHDPLRAWGKPVKRRAGTSPAE